MKQLIFYRQCRRDRAIRMGIALDNDTTLLGALIDGVESREDDPFAHVLEWYIDIRCFGSRLPIEAEPARAWFSRHAESLRNGLRRFAKEASSGWDPVWPTRWDRFEALPRGVRVELVCSATRRDVAIDMPKRLIDFADHFEDYLRLLETPLHATV